MFKLIMTVKKRAGMTRDEFMDYYRDVHLPFMEGLTPQGKGVKPGSHRIHVRNFVDLDDPFLAALPPARAVRSDPPWDVMTEVVFEDREIAMDYFKRLAAPEFAEAIQRDQAAFIDPDTVQYYVVDAIETHRTL